MGFFFANKISTETGRVRGKCECEGGRTEHTTAGEWGYVGFIILLFDRGLVLKIPSALCQYVRFQNI